MLLTPFSRRAALVAQLGLVLFALVSLALVPPSRGPMLLVPLGQTAARLLPVAARAHNALILARGPLPQSLVVYADRAQLLRPLLGLGIVTLASPVAGCAPPKADLAR
ncbi:MAG: hypothetical protein JOY99_05160 [Sphingomonadaceae bacterium]|nr:hypothetical protein [Sphingomonadaceae bacterium]